MSLRHNKEIKFNSHGLFSAVSKKTGYGIAEINVIYSWYVNQTLEELQNQPNCQAFLKNLGILKFNAGLGLRNLTGFVNGLKTSLSDFLNEDLPPKCSYSYLVNRHLLLVDAINSYEERLQFIKSKGHYNETYYVNKYARIELLRKQLNQIYESIQRIPELEQKRTTERGQDFTWTDEQSSTPF